MTEHVLAAWSDEAQGRRVNVHEIAPGIVYRDARVTVTAFNGGYRFQTADRSDRDQRRCESQAKRSSGNATAATH